MIETKPDSTIYFETVRGCPFSCNFCYYNKVYNKIVPVGIDHVEMMFNYARNNGFREIFLLDPTFNVQPKFDKLLDKLIELNKDHHFTISTELRADFLSQTQIEKLVKINLIEAEIGLQTTNRDALKLMDRKNAIQSTIEKTKLMVEAGISCKVDLIVGLPGDSLDGFKQSLNDAKNSGIESDIQVFLLSILSGTEYSKKRDSLEIKRDKIPPYYIESTPTFSSSDIREAIEYSEELLDISLYPIPPYLLSTNFDNLGERDFVEFDSDIKPIHKIVITSSADLGSLQDQSDYLCETLVVHFIIDDNSMEKLITDTLSYLAEQFPHNIYQFILHFKIDPELSMIESLVEKIPVGDQSYLSRDIKANLGVDSNLTSSLAIILPYENLGTDSYAYLQESCDTFLEVTNFKPEEIEDLVEGNNLYFSGDEQERIFNCLNDNDLLDDFTLFEDYMFEMRKESGGDIRCYYPHCFKS